MAMDADAKVQLMAQACRLAIVFIAQVNVAA